ncbi:hypothetical protein ACFSUS_07835, partial [Spirosoma soli]
DWPLNRPMGLQPSRAIGCASPFYLLASYSILGIISPHKPKGRSGDLRVGVKNFRLPKIPAPAAQSYVGMTKIA